MRHVRILALTWVLAGCGAKSKSSDTPTDDGSGGVTSDSGSATGSALTGTDEVTDALTDGSSSSGVALTAEPDNYHLATGDTDITVTRTCEVAASTGVATVVVKRSGSGTLSGKLGPLRTYTVSISGSGSETRVWTPPTVQTSALGCTANNFAKVPWKTDAVIDGLTFVDTFDNALTRTRSVTNSRTKATTTLYDAATAKGTRTVTWSKGSTDATTITRNKTVVLKDVVRTKDYTNKAGDKVSTTATIQTLDGKPLAISVVRNSSTGVLVAKTITSGTTKLEMADSAYVELTFTNVKYDLSTSNSDPCRPVSGTVAGATYTAGATAASSEFTITYDATADEPATITFDKGATTVEYEHNGRGCDLERES